VSPSGTNFVRTILGGVAWRGAAVFLHFSFEDKYPTLAQSALWTWGHEKRVDVNFQFWWAYVEACRALRTECGVTMHDLDLALRQFGDERRTHTPRPTIIKQAV